MNYLWSRLMAFFLLTAGVLCLSANAFGGSVVINEIMFHAAPAIPENDGLEWIELYNKSTNVISLNGWHFTQGVSFTFTNFTLGPTGYVVVAANRAQFTARNPEATNVVGDWVGALSNNGEQIELANADGDVEDSVEYASEGDWAVRQRGPYDLGHYGWVWFCEADGLGKSLELRNPDVSNKQGQNWGVSSVDRGTPGRANSLRTTNIPPMIVNVSHFPLIPRSSDSVTITATIIDEGSNATVRLWSRLDANPTNTFASLQMFDDGLHADGLAGDGVYGVQLPARAAGVITEFYVQATDSTGLSRTWPAAAQQLDGNFAQTCNALYQAVDDFGRISSNPIYNVIMTEIERAELDQIGTTAANSDATMNGTFVTVDGNSTEVRYLSGFRNRGHGSRTHRPNNIRVNIANDHRWKGGVRALNLNASFSFVQVAGSAVFQKAGLPMAFSKPVEVRINAAPPPGGNLSFGMFAHNEELSSEFVGHHFPTDADGNCYRGIRVDPNQAYANLNYYGPSVNDCAVSPACYRNLYFKQNNVSEDDFSDLLELCRVLATTPDDNYTAEVRRVLDVEDAMLYFAANTLADNRETSLSNGEGDDYAMYRGGIDTRFKLLPYDVDTVFGQGDTAGQITASLFRMTTTPGSGVDTTPTSVIRFMNWPEFIPIYYATLKRLIETSFSASQFNSDLDRVLGGWVPDATISAMKSWQASRNAFVLSQIPLALTATTSLTRSNTYFYTTSATASLSGQGNAIDTRSVRVNGASAAWNPVGGTWNISGVPLLPGINRVLVQAFGTNGTEIARVTVDVWYNNGNQTAVAGEISADTIWTPAGSPYVLSGNVDVNASVTLQIRPGTTIFAGPGTIISVYGRILAEGNETNHIRFTKQPTGGNWGSLDFFNGSAESRLAYADIEFVGGSTIGGHNAEIHANNARVFFDHLTFTNTPVVEYISFDASSFIVQNSYFPTYPPPTGPESLHGINGIPAGGYGIFRDNYFGHTWGFNDTIDFTGGNRPGPILQIINNVFDGASDDHLDLDSTDAWIEGNIFMHAHRDPARTDNPLDTSSAISGGVDFVGQNSDWTILNNIFYDVDHVFLNKGNSTTTPNGGGRVAFLYNTVIHVAREYSGSTAPEIAAFDWSDDNIALPDAAIGSGMYAAHNIIYDCSTLHRNYNAANHTVIMDNNILSVPWSGPGSGNQVIDPLLNLGVLNGIAPTNVTVAQLRQAAQLRPGSPAVGAGFGGLNLGGFEPHGIAISGEPDAVTASTSATLTVGPGGTFNWGTNAPQPWGWTAFKWKLDNGAFSAEIPFANNPPFTNLPTIALSNLSNGPHTFYVVGKNDAGYYQDDTFVYPNAIATDASNHISARITASRTWTVSNNLQRLVINEVLAQNSTALLHGDDYPDLIELYNGGSAAVDLSSFGITTDPSDKFKFRFPNGTTIAGNSYLVLYANNPDGSAGLHLGFNLNASGDAVYLYNGNGVLIDSIVFGRQLTDFSIGRLPGGAWGLNRPTFGGPNVAQGVTDGSTLKINEWLADSLVANDFIELYNPDPVPASIGGFYISDAPQGSPKLSPIPALSFVPASGYLALIADGKTQDGADHLDFKLSPNQGQISLLSSNLTLIDCILYGVQAPDVSEGRQPNGGPQFAFFDQPTPGAPNPGSSGSCTVSNVSLNLLPMLTNWRYNRDGNDLGTAWRGTNYDDSGWQVGTALLGVEDCGCLPFPLNTFFPGYVNTQIPYYFRTTFQVATNLTGLNLTLSYVLDDGAVIYLDGAELTRVRMPTGTITAFTLPNTTVGDASTVETWSTSANLTVGTHTVAVEVHNRSNPTSSDIVWGLAIDATRSETNCILNTLVLNEIMANNRSISNSDGTITDWVEIYNPSANTIDLSDMSLTDDLTLPRRWVVPSGVTLAAGAYLVIKFDGGSTASLTNSLLMNSGFGLDGDSDQVFLFGSPATGGGLLSSRVFGIQPPDFSIGRVPNGGINWGLTLPTPGGPNIAAALGNVSGLRVNEWMASPSSGDDWFELYNPDPQPVNLAGLFLTDDITDPTGFYQIPALSFIGGGLDGFVQFHADNKPNKGANHTTFKLSGTGETIGILNPARVLIDVITFGPQDQGVSEGRFPDGSTNITRFPGTETPGASNLRPLYDVVINEVLSHSDPPFEDAIELYNTTPGSIDVSGWYLSDKKGDPQRFRIPQGTVIPSGGFVAFYENQFNPDLGHPPSFALSGAKGEELYLFPTDLDGNLTGYRTSEKFGPAESAVSFGRYLASDKIEFTALSQRTFGADNPADVVQFRTGTGLPNAYPKVGPIVITEIQYHPPDTISGGMTNDNVLDEFIELQNITATNVALYDLAFPSNKWHLRDAVSFTFPDGFSLPAGGFALIVNFDPATNAAQLNAFKNKYPMTHNVPILGPYDGKLDNGGESVELAKPDAPIPPGFDDAGLVPYILADKVAYKDSAPWPKLADGTGNSLQRRSASEYGNDPVNWFAGAPTAGDSNGVAAATLPSITSLTPSHSRAVGVSDTFTVTASGAPTLSYQWYFNGNAIAGATNVSYTIGSVQGTNAGNYSVLIWNSAGAVSGVLRLEVQLPPVITQQPQSRVAPLGGQVAFTVAVRGSLPLTYQWYKNSSPITNATNAVYAIANIQSSDEANYYVVVTNLYGTATSAIAALSLNAAPVIVTPPQSTNVFVGANVTFSVVANGSQPLRYQWKFGNVNISRATNATYTINNVQLTNAGNYTVLVTNAVGSALSSPANLNVTIPPLVTVRATDATASEPSGDTGTFTLFRTNGISLPLTVYFTVGGSATPDSDYVALVSPVTFAAGMASTNIIVTPLNDSAAEPAETVSLTLASAAEYVIASPSNAVVTILDDDNVAPSVTLTNPISGALFNAGDNVSLGASASDSDGSVSKVEFFYDGVNKIGEATSSPFTAVWASAVAGNHVLTAVATDNFGKSATSPGVPITVNARPIVTIGAPVNGTTFFTPANITINVTATDPDGSISLVEFFAGTNFLGNTTIFPYSLTWSNVPLGTYVLTARGTDNRGATTTSPGVTVTVAVPIPNFADMFAQRGLITGYTNFIVGTNTTFTKESGEPDHDGKITFHSGWLSWTAPINGTCSMDTYGSSFDTVLAVYTNRPPTIQTVTNLVRVASNDDYDETTLQSRVSFGVVAGITYHVAVDGYGTGIGSTGSISFHMNLPNPGPVITNQPQSLLVNAGASATFTVGATGPAPLRYQWLFNNSPLSNATNTSLTIGSASAANEGVYLAVVSNNSGSVTSSPATLMLRTAPVFTTPLQAQVVNPGSNVTFTVATSGTQPITYQWRFNGGIISGATVATYTQNNVQYTNGGTYSVTAANSVGQAVSQAELIVRPSFSLLSPAISNGVLRLMVNGTPGKRYSVESGSNVTNWTAAGTVTNSAVQAPFQDATVSSNRTYRLRLLP